MRRTMVLEYNLPGLLQFACACKGLRERLTAVLAQAEARRLVWIVQDESIAVGDEGRTLSMMDGGEGVATAGVLPAAARCSWSFRIKRSRLNNGEGMDFGVCDAEARIPRAGPRLQFTGSPHTRYSAQGASC